MSASILIVDTDSSFRAALAEKLRAADFEVATDVATSSEALQAAERKEIGVALVGVTGDGESALALAKSLASRRSDVCVVFLTSPSSRIEDEAERAGVFEWLPRNADAKLLERSVHRALHCHELTAEVHRLKGGERSGGDVVVLPSVVSDLLSADALERRYVSHVLAMVNGNKSRAARILGFDRRTLYRKLERMANDASGASEGGSEASLESDA